MPSADLAHRPSPPPSTVLAAEHLRGFLHALRSVGLTPVTTKQTDFLTALQLRPPRGLQDLYWLARVTLVSDMLEIDDFDAVFTAWFEQNAVLVTPEPDSESESDVEAPRGEGDNSLPDQDAELGEGVAASSITTTTRRDFGRSTPGERVLMDQLGSAWDRCLPQVSSRRLRPGRGGRRFDMRATVRRARRTGGEIVEFRWRVRPPRRRRLLLLIDVSGSLKQHTPALLRIAHTAVAGAPTRTEVFTFATRLTRITGQLRAHDVDRAVTEVACEITDAHGGTRIGASFATFLSTSRYVALTRGAVVVVLSDGLERGDHRLMVDSVERLARLGHRLVWWSPLASSPTYRPVTAGMSAQLGILDRLGGVHDLATALAEVEHLPGVVSGPRRGAARAWSNALTSGGTA